MDEKTKAEVVAALDSVENEARDVWMSSRSIDGEVRLANALLVLASVVKKLFDE